MSFQDEYAHLMGYSDIQWLPSENVWAIVGGRELQTARIVLPEGGYVEFAVDLFKVNVYFLPAPIRTSLYFTDRPTSITEEQAQTHLDTGLTWITDPEPSAKRPWMFSHEFAIPIAALSFVGPVWLSLHTVQTGATAAVASMPDQGAHTMDVVGY
jgi:hypothetical protein